MNLYFFPIFQCTGSGTSADTCLTATGASPTTPLCATATSHGGNPALGMCGGCIKSDGVAGDGNSQGSCTDSKKRCLSTGACACMVCTTSGGTTTCSAPTDNTMQGTCDAGTVCCMTSGECAASSSAC